MHALWKGIERIETTPGRTFVYLSPMSALVISEHSVLEGNYQAFIEELQNRWQHATHLQRLTRYCQMLCLRL